MSLTGMLPLNSLVFARNFCEYHIAGGLLHIISASSLNKYCNPFLRYMSRKLEVSEGDRIYPPDTLRMFAQRMNATTISLNSSYASPVSHPDEIAQLILDAARGSTG